MKKITLFSTIILLLGAICGISNAQEKFKNRYAIGINYNPEWRTNGYYEKGEYYPSIGITAEAQFTKYHGLEIGIFYWDYLLERNGGRALKAGMISLRGGYKFHSSIVNVGVGANIDWIGNRSLRKRTDNDNWAGFYIVVSKDIPLAKGLIFEPSVRFNQMYVNNDFDFDVPDDTRTFLGMGLKLKYRF